MGADIHLVLERKYKDKWVGVDLCRSRTIFVPIEGSKKLKQEYAWHRASARNYELFAALAGVRGDGPEPKGLPEDASELARTQSEEWDGDGHSHSWCTLEEYIQALVANEYEPAQVFLIPDDPRLKQPYQFYFGMYEPEEDEEYRVVFWFDN